MTAKPFTLSQKPAIGLMSGTSLDGIDGVLVDLDDGQVQLRASASIPLPAALRDTLLALNARGPDELERAALAAQDLSVAYAELVQRLLKTGGLTPAEVEVIGCHGQTVRHQPQRGYTLQLVNGALLAELCGISCVIDFRSRDVAAGGQGAPLVPAFHASAFTSLRSNRVIVNVGGFANLTWLPARGQVLGQDCGPGNVLMDGWIHRQRGQPYDAEGQWALSGQVQQVLLEHLQRHPFFSRAAPRSTGREDFNLAMLDQALAGLQLAPQDVQRTLLELSAWAIARDVAALPQAVDALYVCGGGAHNLALLATLRCHLAGVPVETTATLGLPVEWVEAVAFAWLARNALRGITGNLPAVTGARGPRVLGAIYPA